MRLKPVNDKIVVKPNKKEDDHITEGGIILPDTVQDGTLIEGKVVAVVPPSTNNAQSHIDMLIGEVCRDFKDSNRRYFDWHFEYHSKRLEKE